MKPTKITWICDECGAEFSREVIEVIKDDENLVEVRVALVEHDEDGPLCDHCFGPETTETTTVGE